MVVIIGAGQSGFTGVAVDYDIQEEVQGTIQEQKISFDNIPLGGDWKLSYNGLETNLLYHNTTASTLETEIRNLDVSLVNVLVTGDFSSGFIIKFVDVANPYLLEVIDFNLQI